MTYTYKERKRLNRLLIEKFPHLPWDEDKGEGIPRMRVSSPSDLQPIISLQGLESIAAAYWLQNHHPMPVYLHVADCYEVNYVHPLSPLSIAEAERWISKHAIYCESK